MAYKVTISDGTILGKSIDAITFNADTPPDNSYCMRTYTKSSIQITGRIGAGEKTISLYEWSLLPTNNSGCYKEIVIEQTYADQTVRIVKFSKAFVVDYSESYSKGEGFGHFSIFIRQLAGVDIEVTPQPTSQSLQNTSKKTTPEITAMDNDINPVLAVANIPPSFKKIEGRISATDRIAKLKEQEHNENMKIIEGMGGRPSDASYRFTEEMVRAELATSVVGQQTLNFIDKYNIPVGLTYEPRPDGTFGVCLREPKVVKVFLANHMEIKGIAQTVIHEVTHFMGVQGSKRAEMYCRLRELKHIFKNGKVPIGMLKEQFRLTYNSRAYSKLPLGKISDVKAIVKSRE